MGWWHYLLLVNFYLVLFFAFYALLLSKETFFHLNRIYLVAASLLSFFIPLIQSNWVKSLFITQQVQYTIYSSPILLYKLKPTENILTLGNVFQGLYVAVTVVLALRLLWQIVVIKNTIKKPQPSAAYSFFKKISLGNNLLNPDVIAAHEEVHARQWHSVDVLIIEGVMIINWFNPVVYLYRFAIKYIHEFIADRQVLQSGTDKTDYALLLLSQTFDTPTNGLVSNFYSSSLLRQRIIMLQKNKSKRIALAKYGMSVPLFMMMLILSSATVNNSQAVTAFNKGAEKIFRTPASQSMLLVANPDKKILTETLKGLTTNVLTDEINTHEDSEEYMQRVDASKLVAVKNYSLSIDDANSTAQQKVVFTPIERQPEFPGGIEKFYELLRANIKYPEDMRENRIEGKVFIQFVVEKDGSVTGLKTLRAPGYGSEEETERVLSSLPKWNPGYQNGNAVSVRYIMPIDFKLEAMPNLKDTTSANTYGRSNGLQYIVASPAVNSDINKNAGVAKQPGTQHNDNSLFSSVAALTRQVINQFKGNKKRTI